ncbi:MAG TPA: Na+/H+ antiporter NhaC [Synergistaceae bacterium]|jgi:NhaC family Na+:H+ antiporter|nr:Na+/H+ antiporter NhaC [Synergistaceae bacterium]
MNAKEPRKATLAEALVTFVLLMVIMALGIVRYGLDPHIPMFCGVIIAALMAMHLGYPWRAIEDSMIAGINRAMQSIIILAIIGILIGVWMVSGVVPTMIYYGLNILSPKIFLPAALLICSITSLATGTSWGTAGTMGVALIGIAHGLGVPVAVAAGAIISGAYFGDKMSPLSDTTNLAPAMAGTDVFTHVKFMIPSTAVAYIITLVGYSVIGSRYGSAGASLESVQAIQNGIVAQFTVSPFLLIPPLLVIGAIAKKMPAIPGIVLGILSAAALAPIFQHASMGDILGSGYGGYVSESGVEVIDELLTKGGLEGMMFSISLTMIAMMFGGIVEMTGQLEAIVEKILKFFKGAAGLVFATELTCVFSNITMPEQYISIVIPGRMYAKAYQDMGLHPKTLSNALEGAGTVTSALIPWNTCGVFLTTALGVSTAQYWKWCFFNISMPITVVVMAFMGITVAYMTEDEKKILAETGRV